MVEFVVRVPENLPPGQPVYLAGDGPALGDWTAAGTALHRHADGSYRTRLPITAHEPGRFLVTLGRWRGVEGDGHGHEVPARLRSGSRHLDVPVRGWGRTSIRYHYDFPARQLPHRRTVSVWVPPGYDLEPARRFPVLYLHDGQNLFDPETAFAGNPWYADEAAEREVRAGRVEPLLLVGIANTVDRLQEYGPRRSARSTDRARAYGRFLVDEVKPFIDATYRTLPGPESTGVCGSSMGGLISLSLCQWYPNVFQRCAALSPSLWWDREAFLRDLHAATGWLAHCRLWLDMGDREGATEAGMRSMVGRTRRLALQLRRHGLREGDQLASEIVAGGVHNEHAWGARFDRVLRFLYPSPITNTWRC